MHCHHPQRVPCPCMHPRLHNSYTPLAHSSTLYTSSKSTAQLTLLYNYMLHIHKNIHHPAHTHAHMSEYTTTPTLTLSQSHTCESNTDMPLNQRVPGQWMNEYRLFHPQIRSSFVCMTVSRMQVAFAGTCCCMYIYVHARVWGFLWMQCDAKEFTGLRKVLTRLFVHSFYIDLLSCWTITLCCCSVSMTFTKVPIDVWWYLGVN